MKKYIWGLIILGAGLVAFLMIKAGGQVCTTQSGYIVGYTGGDPSTLSVLDGIENDLTELVLRLKGKGANWQETSNYPVTTNYRMTGAAADFNGDGLVDLVEGGRNCDNNANGTDTNIAIFVSQGKDPGDPTRFSFAGPYYINYLSTFRTYEIMALGAGDFDGDGDADVAALSWQGRLWIFKNLYIENGLRPGDIPVFDTSPTLLGDLINDGYGEFGSDSRYWRWESNIECIDIDGDRDLDLIVGVPTYRARNRWGLVVIYINNGSGVFSRLNQTINPYPASAKYGVCGVAAGDFDGDGDVDFICGSANSRDLIYYENRGGTFREDNGKKVTIPANHGSCTYLRSGDVDTDGDVDFVLATDGWTANPPGGYVYWYENNGTGIFSSRPIPASGARVSPSRDLDSGAIGDFDADGDLDFFVADGNDSRNCYFFMNDTYPIYVSKGTVSSKNLMSCAFISSDDAVVAATIDVQETKNPPRTDIVYYLSNSNDVNGNPKWEGPVTPGVEFEFENPGDFLRWRADFSTQDEALTPKLWRLEIEYKFITKREYSRTSHAFTTVDVNSSREGNEEVLYSASFEFPKWRGHLRSWNVSDLELAYTRGSQLADILDVGATLVEDAGVNLRVRDWASRVVYTAYDREADGMMNDRVDFSPSQADILDDFLLLGLESPEVPLLIRFVLGEDRVWKLGDINHSSPQVLEPPRGIPSKMGTGYDSFKEAYKDRRKVVLAGANDGMLHCFDAATLEELWAFIPNNLLYKLKRMRVLDPDCGYYLNHEFFVDGTPAIQDVYFGGGWHTVVVCGQGSGWGKNQKCYYFALDVTDPESPQPLWEFTDTHMGETWSVPAIGKVESLSKWVVFFGSGYDNDPTETVGHYFYAVDVETGQLISSFEIAESGEPASPFGIQNTLPGSPAIVDKDNDGFIDVVYFSDLLGRLWKMDLAARSWEPTVIYRDPYYHPMVTKPAFYVDIDKNVHLYVGTGGDDRAPANEYYSFVAVVDTGAASASVEWFIGPDDLATKLGINIDRKKGQFVQGEKVWADDVIADRIVYIATLEGSIESLNPCRALAGSGKLYARHIIGNQMGITALLSAEGAPEEYKLTKQKVRSAVTIGETQVLTGEEGQPGIRKRKVFIQSFTQPGEGGPEPPSQVLAQPVPQTALVIKSWREVYKVHKK